MVRIITDSSTLYTIDQAQEKGFDVFNPIAKYIASGDADSYPIIFFNHTHNMFGNGLFLFLVCGHTLLRNGRTYECPICSAEIKTVRCQETNKEYYVSGIKHYRFEQNIEKQNKNYPTNFMVSVTAFVDNKNRG